MEDSDLTFEPLRLVQGYEVSLTGNWIGTNCQLLARVENISPTIKHLHTICYCSLLSSSKGIRNSYLVCKDHCVSNASFK
ncbi:hypothetical protein J6590_101214 [Homalodisca vitripennis]|nr:hypothetical protein J6590_101214 [Homalodisca vitripennis]